MLPWRRGSGRWRATCNSRGERASPPETEAQAHKRGILLRVQAALSLSSSSGFALFHEEDAWNPGHSYGGAWGRNSSTHPFTIVITTVDGVELEQAQIFRGPPQVLWELIDVETCAFIDPSFSADSFAFTDTVTGTLVRFFAYENAEGHRFITAATSSSRFGPGLKKESKYFFLCQQILGCEIISCDKLSPKLSALIDSETESVTFDLCGSEISRLVEYSFTADLLPRFLTRKGRHYPILLDDHSYDDMSQLRTVVVERQQWLDRYNGEMRQRAGQPSSVYHAGFLLWIMDGDGLVQGKCFRIVSEELNARRWHSFTSDQEDHLVRLVQQQKQQQQQNTADIIERELNFDQDTWRNVKKAVLNVANILLYPVAPPPSCSPPTRTMLITVAVPGAGKSHFSSRLLKAGNGHWIIINQDTLRSRDACLQETRKALASQHSVVIDRTNISIEQRRFFLEAARELGVHRLIAVFFDVPPRQCAKRVLQRHGHKTLPGAPDSVGVVLGFSRSLERPTMSEGFSDIVRITTFAESDMIADRFAAEPAPVPVDVAVS